MVSEEAKVRVRLDTRQAKGDLRGLNKEASKSAGKLGASARGALGRGLGVIGFGGLGVAAGLSAIGGPTMGGLGDVMGLGMRSMGESMSARVWGDLDEKGRADRRAAELVTQLYKTSAVETGKFPPQAMDAFKFHRAMFLKEELGATRIRSTLTSESVQEVSSIAVKAAATATASLVNLLKAAFPSFFKK